MDSTQLMLAAQNYNIGQTSGNEAYTDAALAAFSNNNTTSNRIGVASDPGFWSSVIGGATSLVSGFNYKAQENELAIAQANAAAEQAKAAANSKTNYKPYIIVAVIVVVVMIVGLVVLNKSKS